VKLSCTKIQDFWKNVHEHICQILDTHISLRPQLFILGVWTDNELRDKHLMYSVQTSIMIGRQIILRSWKSEEAPSFHEWITELGKVSAFEKNVL